jgi:PAS domain-containing protein
MPKELFWHLWAKIKSGQTFRAVIKNRAKDGTHYWVECIIMPVIDGRGEIVRYIAVRHLLTDEAKAKELFDSATVY